MAWQARAAQTVRAARPPGDIIMLQLAALTGPHSLCSWLTLALSANHREPRCVRLRSALCTSRPVESRALIWGPRQVTSNARMGNMRRYSDQNCRHMQRIARHLCPCSRPYSSAATIGPTGAAAKIGCRTNTRACKQVSTLTHATHFGWRAGPLNRSLTTTTTAAAAGAAIAPAICGWRNDEFGVL